MSRTSGVLSFVIPPFVVFSFTTLVGAEPGRPAPPVGVDDTLWWLPGDTETVMVARGPFKIGDLDPDGPGRGDPTNALRLFTMTALPDHGKRDLIKEREVSLAVSGSRRFRLGDASTGMMVPYEGAEIVVFRDDLGALGDELLMPGKGKESREQIVSGHRIIVEVTEHPDPDVKRARLLYMARPKPNVLIYATDRGYLESVLGRMETRGKTRAFPEDSPEWKHLDPAARFWAVRHYDRKNGPADLTSPFARNEPALIVVPLDEQAVGLVVTIPPDQPGILRLTYLRSGKIGRARSKSLSP